MRTILIFLSIFVWTTCDNNSTVRQNDNSSNDLFKEFRKHFKIIDLPFSFNYIDFKDNLDFDQMYTANHLSSDTLFFRTKYPEGVKCYAMLRDTTRFFAFIYFFPADSYYPVLTTFDLNGKFLSQSSLIVNGCGGDCGLQHCSETSLIKRDFSIYCADTLTWEYFCDSLSQPIPNSDIVWVDSKKGYINKVGLIKMSKDRHEEFKNSR